MALRCKAFYRLTKLVTIVKSFTAQTLGGSESGLIAYIVNFGTIIDSQLSTLSNYYYFYYPSLRFTGKVWNQPLERAFVRYSTQVDSNLARKYKMRVEVAH